MARRRKKDSALPPADNSVGLTTFNYDAPDAADVSSVVDAIMSSYRLAPLTEEQKQQRQIEREIWQQRRHWESERQAERYRRKQEDEAAKAEMLAAIARHEAAEKARKEFKERSDRQQRESEIAGMRRRLAQHDAWQRGVECAARNAVDLQQRQAVIDALDRIVNPPQEPEPQIVYVEQSEGSDRLGDRDFSIDAWMRKPRSWW